MEGIARSSDLGIAKRSTVRLVRVLVDASGDLQGVGPVSAEELADGQQPV